MKKFGALLGSILIVCLVLSGCGGGSSKSNTQSSGATKTLASITVTTPECRNVGCSGSDPATCGSRQLQRWNVADIILTSDVDSSDYHDGERQVRPVVLTA